MKKLMTILLNLGLVFPLVACGDNSTQAKPFEFEVVLGDPVIVAQGEPVNFTWGYVNFPGIHYTKDGNIVVTWEEGTDSVDNYTCARGMKISLDGGATWVDSNGYATESVRNPMPNGKYFAGFVVANAHEQDYLDKYQPAVEYGDQMFYFAEDLANEPAATNDVTFMAKEYDAETDTYNTFQVQVNWPYAPLHLTGNLVYPVQQIFALQNQAVITVGNDLYLPVYYQGFDSCAESRQKAIEGRSSKSCVYVFKSSDSGRTWDFLSQISSVNYPDLSEGFDEPKMTVMPDGSFFMLMRTGSVAQPCYFVRSTDGGLTWSEPAVFDSIGVLPQLLTLKCGVTLATYGRPELRIRATSDPSGLEWETPINKKLMESCYYTRMIALDDNTALLVYIDGGYKNADGDPVKSVVTRTITIVPKDK